MIEAVKQMKVGSVSISQSLILVINLILVQPEDFTSFTSCVIDEAVCVVKDFSCSLLCGYSGIH